MSESESIPITRITENGIEKTADVVVTEWPLTIMLNDKEVINLVCSPAKLDYLAVGYLFSEGLIDGREDIENIAVDREAGIVRVETRETREPPGKRFKSSSGGSGALTDSLSGILKGRKIESTTNVTTTEVFALIERFQGHSPLFESTGGVHSAALSNNKEILVFSDDIGRHNAMDKVIGECLLKGIPSDDHLILTSGRISSEILLKVARLKVPVIVSVSAPTSLAVRLATEAGMTLIGFVRGKRMNIYTGEWRVPQG